MANENTSTTLNNERLLSLVERIEHLDEEIDDLKQDRKDIMIEAKSAGFDTKAINHVVKLRKKNASERELEEELFTAYEHAVGL